MASLSLVEKHCPKASIGASAKGRYFLSICGQPTLGPYLEIIYSTPTGKPEAKPMVWIRSNIVGCMIASHICLFDFEADVWQRIWQRKISSTVTYMSHLVLSKGKNEKKIYMQFDISSTLTQTRFEVTKD